MESKPKKILWTIILLLSLIVLIISACIISLHYFSGKDYNGKTLNQNKQETTSEKPESDVNVDFVDNPIDFDSLKEINTDIYAWIRIPGTDVDYPVVQAGEDHDDFFYLSHNIEKNYEFAGSIYSEKQNQKDFSDAVTVLYGHNMKNGTMFATLHNFSDASFFKKHKFMYIYLPGRKLTYKVYAAYEYDDRHILNSFDFSDSEVVKSYFESTLQPTVMNCNIRKGVSLSESDKILTLSTCTDNNNSARYLVQGVLYKNEQTK